MAGATRDPMCWPADPNAMGNWNGLFREGVATNVTWNGSLGAGAATNFGFLGNWTGTNGAPTLTCTAS